MCLNRITPILLVVACAMTVACTQPATTPPSLAEIREADFSGVNDLTFTLTDGEWEGEPYAPGGASRPRAGLAPEFYLAGDLDGDGAPEAVVSIWYSGGGSGTFDYLAVVAHREGGVENIGTAPIGDRISILDGRIENGQIVLKVLQQGPGDAACCPTAEVTRTWALESGGLIELIANP